MNTEIHTPTRRIECACYDTIGGWTDMCAMHAAAPELLAVCKAVIAARLLSIGPRDLSNGALQDELRGLVKQAEAALARAEPKLPTEEKRAAVLAERE